MTEEDSPNPDNRGTDETGLPAVRVLLQRHPPGSQASPVLPRRRTDQKKDRSHAEKVAEGKDDPISPGSRK